MYTQQTNSNDLAVEFRQTGNFKKVCAILILPFLLAGCLDAVTRPTVSRSDLQGNPDNYNGPKIQVAVATVGWKTDGVTDSFHGQDHMGGDMNQMDSGMQHMGDWVPQHTHGEYSNGLTEQLINSLLATNRYRILEQGHLNTIMREMQLHNQNQTAGDSQLDGADLLIIATVTGWSPASSGTQMELGGLIDRKFSTLISDVAGGVTKSEMSMNVRLVDVRSREILGSTEVRTIAKNVNLGSRLAGIKRHSGLTGGLSTYQNTSMEKAIRAAMLEATDYITGAAPQQYARWNP